MHCDTFWNFLQRNAFLFLSPKALSPLPCSVIPVVRKPCSHLAACDRMVSEGRFEGHFNVSQNRLNPAACGLILANFWREHKMVLVIFFFKKKEREFPALFGGSSTTERNPTWRLFPVSTNVLLRLMVQCGWSQIKHVFVCVVSW